MNIMVISLQTKTDHAPEYASSEFFLHNPNKHITGTHNPTGQTVT